MTASPNIGVRILGKFILTAVDFSSKLNKKYIGTTIKVCNMESIILFIEKSSNEL